MAQNDLAPRVESVRRFNRFYTKQIGALSDHILKSPFSLAEARVIYELAQRENATATELGGELGLDAGYLSRLLAAFKKRGLIARKPSETDGRQSFIWLTEKGRKAFAELNAHSHNEIEALIGRLSPADRNRLIEAMRVIEETLGAQPEQKIPYIIRPHQPGDMGWVTHRHGVIYNEEYGWDEEFEALVAEIAAKFIRNYDPKRERCWIAERGGEIVGSVFLVKKSKTVAQLRLLLVEPSARGMGIGKRLVSECLRFARQTGYKKIMLWTNSALHAARHIYEEAGFRLVKEEPHHSFGHDLVGQNWELKL
ncbi:MAG TPA: helix-turn-helix domain-containing GNAT family N-acetyltransferase [Blastocatellia bacterium]|jgi:DNA-binding MarR family transcriptional regulator/GNAT superfamily N-acetyltransferase|nr:helix-turn-helix domain-containing GNAT family N-acetyltransferase [Blastocatellia bacterium]